jgi:hypothetical protein
VNITMQVEPLASDPAAVEYRWDTDTAILIANFGNGTREGAQGMSGSIELAGQDGSWLILDVQHGCLEGIEVAVWPDVTRVPTLELPENIDTGHLRVSAEQPEDGVALLQVDTTLVAESDVHEQTVHFTIGSKRPGRTLRVARDVLVDLGDQCAILGIWLLNVPRFPDGQ